MTQTRDTSLLLTATRPRPSSALPVLISIPKLATGPRGPRPRIRRRRLRREVRLAGYALLAILPVSMAFIFAGTGLPTLAAGLISDRRSVEADAPFVISLEPLEPKIAARRDGDSPVILPGYLLPADLSEESSDGGH